MMKTYRPNCRTFLLLAILFAVPILTFGQRVITGTVSDQSNGDPLIGATISFKNTIGGTTTEFDGSYAIEIPSEDVILVFSYVGYNSKEVPVNALSIIDVTLGVGQLLDEVVVIGYGEVKREDATGSIQSIDSESFNKGAIAGPQQLLSGKVAGVSITTDGSPGGGSAIRIRGESSLGASNSPLIVVDGIPLDNGGAAGSRNALNIVNPSDIESMTVLKDASATAIYGNRASAGVILITTKKGKSGSLKIGYNANISVGQIAKKSAQLSPDEFRDAVRTYVDTSNSALDLLRDDISTDWQDEIYQQSIGMDHNLTVSGGIGGVPFRASAGYTDFDGLLKTDNFKRLSGNISVNPRLLDNRLQINAGLRASRIENTFADRGAIGTAISFDPTKPVFVDDAKFGNYFSWKNPDGSFVGLAPANPVALLEQKNDQSTVNRYIASFSADYRFPFLPALRANLNLAHDQTNSDGFSFIDTTAAFAYDPVNGGGTDNKYKEEKGNTLLEAYLNYKEKLFGNDFDIMAGYSWQKFFFDKTDDNSNITRTDTSFRVDNGELYLLSLFGRVNYSIGDRVLLTGTLRQDQSSRFSPENRSGLFPSAAVAVKAIDNDNDLFNSLKVRLGWGRTGQQDIGGFYLWQGLYENSDAASQYQLGDSLITTTRPNGYDAGIQWETTSTYNLGADFSIIKNRLSGSLDLYQRKTKDLLVSDVPTVVGSNLTNIITTNLGNMESRGIEIGLNITPILSEKTTWDIGLNAAVNKNEITKLSNDSTSLGILTGGISGGVGNNIQIHSVGFEPYSFFVYEQVYNEDGTIIPGEFVDRNEDGVINLEDRYRIEATRPDVTIGFTSTLNHGNFDFSFAARASLGNKLYNNVKTSRGNTRQLANLGILNNIHPIALEQNIEVANDVLFSDHFIEDASFLRFDHITLGYTFNNVVGDFLRVFTTVQNPILITKYDGIDPEIFNGIDNDIYPRARTFVFGLGVEF